VRIIDDVEGFGLAWLDPVIVDSLAGQEQGPSFLTTAEGVEYHARDKEGAVGEIGVGPNATPRGASMITFSCPTCQKQFSVKDEHHLPSGDLEPARLTVLADALFCG
jgi:hypothetical protein